MIANLAEFSAPPETPANKRYARQEIVGAAPMEKVKLPAPQVFTSVVLPATRRLNGWMVAAAMCQR